MANIIQTLEAEEVVRVLGDKQIPEFSPGDTLIVNVKIKEGERERVQAFEGVCILCHREPASRADEEH